MNTKELSTLNNLESENADKLIKSDPASFNSQHIKKKPENDLRMQLL
jgi:hypothetical protein